MIFFKKKKLRQLEEKETTKRNLKENIPAESIVQTTRELEMEWVESNKKKKDCNSLMSPALKFY